MSGLYFWNEWQRPYKNLYWFFIGLFLLVILYASYNYLIGNAQVVHWETIPDLDQLKIIIHEVMAGNFKFEIPVDNYVVFQYFRGSDLEIQAYNGYIFLIFLIISVNLIMALLPDLPKVWFYAGMGGFIGFAVLLNIDQIMLFERSDKTALIIVLTLYLSAGYFFKEINENIGLFKRFGVFCLISVLIAVLFSLYAGVNDPFLYIASYGVFAPVLITVLFIIFIAHEILFGFLYLITSSNTVGSKNSLPHFVIISLIYLAYVAITYMHYTRQIQWDLVYLNPFLVGGLTFILGIWGYKRREELFSEIFGFYPVGALFYLGFGIISTATLSYIFSTANDPLMETFEDVILYSQIGFGILFFMYVITNFGPMLAKNMKVARIVYQSRVFPFFIFRIGGLLVFGYLFYSSNFLPYYQAMAGYYNFIGDNFLLDNQLELAEEYYVEASDYEFQNHRSNYAMATLARWRNDRYDEAYYFNNALLKQPSEFAYANASNIYLENDQFFDGMFKLQEGLDVFPDSRHLLNNMGYCYSRSDLTDSAFYYFDRSYQMGWHHDVPASNVYGLIASAGIDIPVDTLKTQFSIPSDDAGTANLWAIKNQNGDFMEEGDLLFDPGKDFNFRYDRFASLHNRGVNSLKSEDTDFFSSLRTYGDSSGVDMYRSRLTVLASLNYYFNHQLTESFRLLYELGEMSVFNDEYFNMLGILAIDAGSPRLAVDYFNRTSIQVNDKYRLHLGVAYAECGLLEEADQIFRSLINSSDASIRVISEEYLFILNLNTDTMPDSLDDEDRYMWLHLIDRGNNSTTASGLFESIENPAIRILIRIENTERLIRINDIESAYREFLRIDAARIPDPLKIRFARCQHLFRFYGKLDRKVTLDTGITRTSHPLYQYHQLLLMSEGIPGRDTVRTDSVYKELATWNPFFEQAVIAAVDYFDNVRYQENYAYNLLVNALTINSYSESLNKFYIDYCIADGMTDFARNRLQFMNGFMTNDKFSDYFLKTLERIKIKENEIISWGE